MRGWLTRQLKALADRISDSELCQDRVSLTADESTICSPAYARAAASRVSVCGQEVLDMDAERLERTARRLTDRLDEMELERRKPS
jgi:hypothetical protein